MKGIVRLSRSPKILNELLDKLDWPSWPIGEVLLRLKDSILQLCRTTFDDETEETKEDILQWESPKETILFKLSELKTAPKPRVVASRLGISRESIYSLRRKIRRAAAVQKEPRSSLSQQRTFTKEHALRLIRDFAHENIHKFYTAADVQKMLQKSNEFERTPSLSTIRRWMKGDLRLWFKKVNIRFKQWWTSEDQITKLKYLWIYIWLVKENLHIVYADEFSLSDSSIKHYSWTFKGKPNYWFGNRKN